MALRYLIINAYSARNAGDAAIVLATATVVRGTSGAEIRSASRYFEQDREFYDAHDITVVPPLVPFAPRSGHGPGRQRALALTFGTLAAFAIVAFHRCTTSGAQRLAGRLGLDGLRELLAADRVIVCGGGYLYSAQALNLTLVHATISTKLAQLAGKTPLMMPQSVGPLPRRFDRLLVSWGYSKVRPIVVRDEFALEEARAVMPARAEEIEVCADIAFVGWQPPGSTAWSATARTGVGIVAMDWTWAREGDGEKALSTYVAKLASVAQRLAARGFDVWLYGNSRIPEMDQDDIAVAQRIVDAAGDVERVQIDRVGDTTDVTKLLERLGSLSVVIGTRLHSCIMAMSAGTPAIALAYQPKSVGTFRLLNLEEYCFDVEGFGVDQVERLAAELVEGGARCRDVVADRVATVRSEIHAFYSHRL